MHNLQPDNPNLLSVNERKTVGLSPKHFYEINYKSETIKKGGKVLRCNVCQVQNIKKMEW